MSELRQVLVQLKRSIDPHESDPTRYVILRKDFDPIWDFLVEICTADETSSCQCGELSARGTPGDSEIYCPKCGKVFRESADSK